MTATVGRRWTVTSASPTAASMPISRELSTAPARSTVSPRAMSPPAAASAAPGVAGRRSSSHRTPSPSAAPTSVCSTMTTASAPRGSIPPVAITVAVPGATVSAGTMPGVTSSGLIRSRHGWASDASAVSAARRANPSTLARSKPGTSTAATTSLARTRCSASPSGTRSLPRGRGSSSACSRALASSSPITSRNCCWRAARARTASKAAGVRFSSAMAMPEEVDVDLAAGRMTLRRGRYQHEADRGG